MKKIIHLLKLKETWSKNPWYKNSKVDMSKYYKITNLDNELHSILCFSYVTKELTKNLHKMLYWF